MSCNPRPELKDAIGFLARNGKKFDVICPFCGWVHTFDARDLLLQAPCRLAEGGYIQITGLKQGPVPTQDLIDAKNKQIKIVLRERERREEIAAEKRARSGVEV